MFYEADNKASDPHLRTHIEKLGKHTLDQMRMGQELAESPFFIAIGLTRLAGANFWQVRKINQRRDEQKNGGNYQVRNFYQIRFGRYVGLQVLRSHCRPLRCGVFYTRQNERSAKSRHERSADGV